MANAETFKLSQLLLEYAVPMIGTSEEFISESIRNLRKKMSTFHTDKSGDKEKEEFLKYQEVYTILKDPKYRDIVIRNIIFNNIPGLMMNVLTTTKAWMEHESKIDARQKQKLAEEEALMKTIAEAAAKAAEEAAAKAAAAEATKAKIKEQMSKIKAEAEAAAKIKAEAEAAAKAETEAAAKAKTEAAAKAKTETAAKAETTDWAEIADEEAAKKDPTPKEAAAAPKEATVPPKPEPTPSRPTSFAGAARAAPAAAAPAAPKSAAYSAPQQVRPTECSYGIRCFNSVCKMSHPENWNAEANKTPCKHGDDCSHHLDHLDDPENNPPCKWRHFYDDEEVNVSSHRAKNPKFKTEICRNGDHCPYGDRCCFIHPPKAKSKGKGKTA